MASLAHQFTGLGCPLSSFSRLSKSFFFPKQQRTQRRNFVTVVVASGVSREQKEEWRKLRELFAEAREQCEKECEKALTEDISFIEDDILAALPEYAYNYEIGAKIKGTVFHTEANGAVVEIFASSGYLPTQEACIHKIRNVKEAGIVPGLKDEFKIIGVDKADESFILSLRAIQHDLAWERCSQLQKEDIVVKGKVVGSNKGGLFALVEGLRGFIPFSLISTKLTAEELLDKELPLKFVEVDAEQSRLVLNHRKAIADTQAQLETGLVVTGTVQSLKPYGAFIDIGGINGLLHVSQISHDRVSDIQTVLQTGDTIKAMVLSHDRQRSRLSLSTKKLEPTPGDMIRNPKIVFEKAEEMAQTFRQRIAQAEAMARADVLRFQPESGLSLNPDGILRPFSLDSLADGLSSSNTPPADNKESEESNF